MSSAEQATEVAIVVQETEHLFKGHIEILKAAALSGDAVRVEAGRAMAVAAFEQHLDAHISLMQAVARAVRRPK